MNEETACDDTSGLMSALHTASEVSEPVNPHSKGHLIEKKIPPEDQCVLPHCVHIFNLFTPTLQFRSLCFYEMLKKMEENNSFFKVLFCQTALCCICVVAEKYSVDLCSVRELLSSE